jgi:CubicO group peptidase (beta-lactamase class C family)
VRYGSNVQYPVKALLAQTPNRRYGSRLKARCFVSSSLLRSWFIVATRSFPLTVLAAASALACSPASPRAVSPIAAPLAAPAAVESRPAVAVDPSGRWDLRWDRAFAGETPPIVEGKLELLRSGDSWSGALVLTPETAKLAFESVRVDGNRIELAFIDSATGDRFELSGSIRANRLVGEARLGNEESGTKSIVSLAIGLLVAEGKLSLDTQMGALFPEWRAQGAKGTITVRHLLTHTSGLDPSRAGAAHETIRVHAEKAKLLTPPGTRFQYNNASVDFLAVVVKQVSGVPLDEYLETHIFRKLDVVGARWIKDREGTPLAAGELLIRPVDFAKIGQMLLDGGRWHGEQIISPEWIELSIAAGQTFQEDYGLLWWREGEFAKTLTEPLLSWWREVGVDEATVKQARRLVGKKIRSGEYKAALMKTLGKESFAKLEAALEKVDHVPLAMRVTDGAVTGYSARGWLGQSLVVFPKTRVVAVRMRNAIYSDYDGGDQRHGYDDFRKDAARLF